MSSRSGHQQSDRIFVQRRPWKPWDSHETADSNDGEGPWRTSTLSTPAMKFYNEDGKPSSVRERARSARATEGRVFARLVTSADTLRRLELLRTATVAQYATMSTPMRRPQSAMAGGGPLQFQRVLAARAARNFQAKSARARLRTTEASDSAGMTNVASAPIADGDDGDDSLSTIEAADVNEDAVPDPVEIDDADDKTDDSSEVSSCRSCLALVMAQRAEKPLGGTGAGAGAGAVATGGKRPALKMAMADFSRKIEDNEGTEISTFSYMVESSSGQELTVPEQPDESSSAAAGSATSPEVTPLASQTDMSREALREAAKKLHKQKKKLNELTPLDRLKRAVKTVNLLIKACTTKEEQTRKNQMRMMTFSDIAGNLSEESKNDELNFQLSYYKAKKEMTLSAEAQEILRLHPFLRTKEMLHAAMVSLQTAVEAFSEFPINMKMSLVKVGWYEKFNANQVIIRQGHNALNYYFIISGTTAVSVALKKPSGEPFNKTVAFLRKGESFGELALLYGGKRSATVYCKDEVELLAVSREDFIDIFMNLDTEEEPEHISFLRDIPTMVGWPIDKLPYDNPKVCMFAYFRKGIVLCRDSNAAEFVYIVKSGHCLVMKDLEPCSSTIPKLRSRHRMCEGYPVEEDTDSQRYLDFMHRDCLPVKSGRGDAGSARMPRIVAKPSGKLFVQLKILQKRDTFGLEPIAFRVFGGTTGVTLVSMGAECILISKEFFLKHMTERYYQLLRREIQMFPTIENLNEKLQSYYNWDAYKETLVDFVVRPRYMT